MKVNIYTLSDPTNNQIKYVGKTTTTLRRRLFRHLTQADKDTTRGKWIKSLIAQNLVPKIDLVDEVSESVWREEEKFYISYLRYLGFDLVNTNIGGDGLSAGFKQSEETLAKKRESAKNYKPKPDHLKKWIEGGNKFKKTAEFKELISRANGGKQVAQYSKTGELIKIHRNASQASISMGFDRTAVWTFIKTRNGQSKDFIWKYI